MPRRQSAGRATGPERLDLGLELDAEALCAPAGGPRPSRAITSAVVASPWFSTKFACLAENPAPPTRRPRQPAASSSWPAVRPSARGSSGFLNVEPNVLIPHGCAALRRARIVGEGRLDVVGLAAGASAKLARATISSGPQVRAAVGEAELVGGAALGARAG